MAENYFKQIKSEDEEKVKCGRFIDTNYLAVQAAYKQLNLKKSKVLLKKRQKSVDETDNLLSEESWNKKPDSYKKSRSSHQEGKNLKKSVNDIQLTSLVFNSNGTVRTEDYYYASDLLRQYFVACTQNINDDKIWLYGDDYIRLYNQQWLFNFTIHYCANLLFWHSSAYKKVAYVSCEISGIILIRGCQEVKRSFFVNLKPQWLEKEAIFVPLNLKNQHWVLFLLILLKDRHFISIR